MSNCVMCKRSKNRIKIDYKIDENNCYICISHKYDKGGYSNIHMYGKTTRVHRHIYEEMFGFIPKGMEVRHKCDNPNCINPEHLELGTHKDNMRDMSKRNRASKKGNPKLTWKQVIEIREKYKNTKITQKELAKEYGISRYTISDITNNKRWRNENL